jgi:hypothetical protein
MYLVEIIIENPLTVIKDGNLILLQACDKGKELVINSLAMLVILVNNHFHFFVIAAYVKLINSTPRMIAYHINLMTGVIFISYNMLDVFEILVNQSNTRGLRFQNISTRQIKPSCSREHLFGLNFW